MKSDRDNINVETFIASSQELRLSTVRTAIGKDLHCSIHGKLTVPSYIFQLVKLLKPCSRQPGEGADKQRDFQAGCLAKGSVIVYVWRQRDTEVVAESIQASGVSGGVVCYHGGMDSGARSNAYSKVRMTLHSLSVCAGGLYF